MLVSILVMCSNDVLQSENIYCINKEDSLKTCTRVLYLCWNGTKCLRWRTNNIFAILEVIHNFHALLTENVYILVILL